MYSQEFTDAILSLVFNWMLNFTELATNRNERRKKNWNIWSQNTTTMPTEKSTKHDWSKNRIGGFFYCLRSVNGCIPHPIHVREKKHSATPITLHFYWQKEHKKYIYINWICSVYLFMRYEFKIHVRIRRAPKILCCFVCVLPLNSQESKNQQTHQYTHNERLRAHRQQVWMHPYAASHTWTPNIDIEFLNLNALFQLIWT